jgi:hypothetical protein
MDWLKTAAEILVGWTALSVMFVVAWSRFMAQLRRKEAELNLHPPVVDLAQRETGQLAA